MAPVTRVRSQAAGIDYLYHYASTYKNIDVLGVEHTTLPDSADAIVKRFNAAFPKVPIVRSTVSPVLGVYGGPNALAVTVLETEGK